MKNILIVTLGNRDLQILPNHPNSKIENDWLLKNHDSTEELYLINTKHAKYSFFDISKMLFEKINEDAVVSSFRFPMLDLSINRVTRANLKIILTTSDQSPNDKQDCKYISKICSILYSRKGYNLEVRNFNINPTDFEGLAIFYSGLFDDLVEHNPGSQVFLSNSGGTPDMRSATYFAGFLRRFKYFNVNARESKVEEQTFDHLEKRVMHLIVKKMVSSFDYQGIINLNISHEVSSCAQNALDHYNLNVELVPKRPENERKLPYDRRASKSLILLVDNMRLCYIQGRYAECLQRLFRIEEAGWYLIFYNYLKDNDHLDRNNCNKVVYESEGKTRRKDFESEFIVFSNRYLGEFLTLLHGDLIEEKSSGFFIKSTSTNSDVPFYGKNLFYHYFKIIGQNGNFCDFFAILNKDPSGISYSNSSRLNSLRNRSFLGHGVNGVKKEDFDTLVDGSFERFDTELRALFRTELSVECIRVFDNFNDEILGLLGDRG